MPWTRRLGQVWGRQAVAGECMLGSSPPRSSGLELRRFLLLWQCWLRFGEDVGAGSSRPSAFTPVAGVCVGEAGGGPLRPPSPGARGWGDVGSLCSAPLQLPASPAPPSAPASSGACQPGFWPPWAGTPPPAGALGPDVQRGAVGTRGRASCRLTGRSQADPVRVWSQRVGLERKTGQGGQWAPGIPSWSPSSPVLGMDELFIRMTRFWKCELACLSYTPTKSLLACDVWSTEIPFQHFAALPPPMPEVYSSFCSLATQSLPPEQTDHPHLAPPVAPFLQWPRSSRLPITCGFH